jgi:phosphocarrier protein HPr|tara:strand:- start:100 stop:369 length:270 start_codon:yes stop_codon:yes gene_type:complete
MISEKVTVQNKLGLHARAASVFVKKAMEFSSAITIYNSKTDGNGKSIMSMMMLEASQGTELELKIEGEDEQLALQALIELVEQKFGEDE